MLVARVGRNEPPAPRNLRTTSATPLGSVSVQAASTPSTAAPANEFITWSPISRPAVSDGDRPKKIYGDGGCPQCGPVDDLLSDAVGQQRLLLLDEPAVAVACGGHDCSSPRRTRARAHGTTPSRTTDPFGPPRRSMFASMTRQVRHSIALSRSIVARPHEAGLIRSWRADSLAFVWLDPGITPCCKSRKIERRRKSREVNY